MCIHYILRWFSNKEVEIESENVDLSHIGTYLIKYDVDAAPREVENFVKPRSER